MGPNFVPAYQVSGIPYVTGSGAVNGLGVVEEVINFPQVTRFFCVTNTGANTLRVGFTAKGVDGSPKGPIPGNTTKNWFEVPAGKMSPRLEIRCKQVWVRSASATTGFTIIAGLSAVSADQFPVLTGTLVFSGTDGKPFADGIGRKKFEGVG
tara:strand:+ start:5052 stop:5507 length:456 start_codon:yes stop_codon:yes gene_type:complete